jgi:hypothetical protein
MAGESNGGRLTLLNKGQLVKPPQIFGLIEKNAKVAPFKKLVEFIGNRSRFETEEDNSLVRGRRVLTDLFAVVSEKKKFGPVISVTVNEIQYDLRMAEKHAGETGIVLIAPMADTFSFTPSGDGRIVTIGYAVDHSIHIPNPTWQDYGELKDFTIQFQVDGQMVTYELVFPIGRYGIKDIPQGKGINYRGVVKGDSPFGFFGLSVDDHKMIFLPSMKKEGVVVVESFEQSRLPGDHTTT